MDRLQNEEKSGDEGCELLEKDEQKLKRSRLRKMWKSLEWKSITPDMQGKRRKQTYFHVFETYLFVCSVGMKTVIEIKKESSELSFWIFNRMVAHKILIKPSYLMFYLLSRQRTHRSSFVWVDSVVAFVNIPLHIVGFFLKLGFFSLVQSSANVFTNRNNKIYRIYDNTIYF